jgi:hypothetical protein
VSGKKLEELSSEDLLKALETPEQTVEVVNTPPVLEFIERFGIKSGNFPVESRLLYGLFLKYYPRVSIRKFTAQANKLLNYKKQRFYLNKDSKLLYHELHKNTVKKTIRASRNTTSSVTLQRHFGAFFAAIELTPGTTKVPWFILYHLYRCYCIDTGKKCTKSPIVFNNYMKLHFEHFTNDNGPVFSINVADEMLPNKGDYAQIEKIYEKENAKRRVHVPSGRKVRKSKNTKR